MRKKFNITGSCNPEWHYMVDITEHFEAVERLIETGMDIKTVSEEIYKYTNGYPFLVSKLCNLIAAK